LVPLSEVGGANWYALYTAPRHEKRVADQISRQDIACFLPLYRSVRRWKDRRKELALVLFPGYVFVRMALQHRLRVLQLPGAVRLVTFNGQPVPLPEAEIETLQNHLSCSENIEPHPLPKRRTPRPSAGWSSKRIGRHHPAHQGPLPHCLVDSLDHAFGGCRSG